MPSCPDTTSNDAFWSYCPSLGAAILFAILFFLVTLAHIVQAIQYRKAFLWVLTMGSLWELLGFIFRILAIYYPKEWSYTPQFILILIAPLWINAFCYMLLGRMVYFWLPDKRLFGIRAQRMGLVFVLLDFACFVIQLVGGFMTSGSDIPYNQLSTGLHIYTGGVALQTLVLLTFLGLVTVFRHRIHRKNPLQSNNSNHLIKILYTVLILILIRSIFRLVEFGAGAKSSVTEHIQHHEWFMYVFDVVLMWIAVAAFNVYHPGRVLVGEESEFPKKSRAEKKMEKREKKTSKKEKAEVIKMEKRAKKAAKKDERPIVRGEYSEMV